MRRPVFVLLAASLLVPTAAFALPADSPPGGLPELCDGPDPGWAHRAELCPHNHAPGAHRPDPEPAPVATFVPEPPAPAPATPSVATGDYAIPSYIVACESGGDYGAVNPTSGAYGAYQIMPSTSAAYGCDMSTPAGQDACAAEIYAAEGAAPWSCG